MRLRNLSRLGWGNLLLGLALVCGITSFRARGVRKPGSHPVCRLPSEFDGYRKKATVLGVFTTWSLKSQVQIQRFRKLAARIGDRVGFLMVLTDPNRAMVEGWIRAYHPRFPVLHPPAFRLCGKKIRTIPFTAVLDRRDRLHQIFVGPTPSADLEAAVNRVLR